MTKQFVITIARESGSGGRMIGQLLAQKLGIKCYDKELLSLAAKESGMSEEIMEQHDEKKANSLIYSLVMDTYALSYNNSNMFDMPLNHKVFLAQFETIKRLADQESCVIIGRCADYALSEHKNVVSIFIHANQDYKINNMVNDYGHPADKAKSLISKSDKRRASYYSYHTGLKWGDPKNYNLCIDSSKLGTDKTADVIIAYMKELELID